VPPLNIPFRDLKLRPEFEVLYPYAGIEAANLITLDDLPGPAKLKPENTYWVLVDHNALQGALGDAYSGRVRGVVDHHDDEGVVPKVTDPEPRIVEKCGSCTSLVVAYCQEAWDADSTDSRESSAPGRIEEEKTIEDAALAARDDAQVAQLGLASILMDTTNLTSKEKTKHKDTEAVRYLESKIRMDPEAKQKYNRDAFFHELQSAKQSVGDLDLHDILRKDYKQWTEGNQKLTLGISSVVKPMGFLIEKAAAEAAQASEQHTTTSTSTPTLTPDQVFLEAIQKYAQERGLNVCAIMTISNSSKDEFQRELFLWTENRDVARKLETFEKEARQDLGLVPSQDGIRTAEENGGWRRTWLQKDVGKSRKQVAPLLRRHLNG
jgi:exopolyphosphatase